MDTAVALAALPVKQAPMAAAVAVAIRVATVAMVVLDTLNGLLRLAERLVRVVAAVVLVRARPLAAVRAVFMAAAQAAVSLERTMAVRAS